MYIFITLAFNFFFIPFQVNFITLGWAANVMAHIKSSINFTFFVVRYDVSKDNHYRRHISFSKSKATRAIMRTDFPFPHLYTHSHTYLLTHILSYIIIYALTCEHGYVMNEANWNSLRLLEIHRKLREKEKEWNVWNVTNSLFSIWFGVAVFFKNFDKIPLPF